MALLRTIPLVMSCHWVWEVRFWLAWKTNEVGFAGHQRSTELVCCWMWSFGFGQKNNDVGSPTVSTTPVLALASNANTRETESLVRLTASKTIGKKKFVLP